ncbi:pleckstrin homology domain-containing family G member 7 isoform X2 [Scyliorhinus canicula]|uniref:pleckstrin homology domain-containing family G member 7 isoform X2 n=1 Tax=Scyliorhinus canicula TaxID=7830 RepID=UPI0018F4C7C5|nr:pleckstrin homology domain-containing family G member 7 isoform X2 [Scyliorhinus canicula]
MEVNVQNLHAGTYLEMRDRGCEAVNLDADENTLEEKNGLNEGICAWKHDTEARTSPFQMEDNEGECIKSLADKKPLPIFKYSSSPDLEVSQSPCFQFDRSAPARVSLSPSLRRMRKNMLASPAPQEPSRAGRQFKDTEEHAPDSDTSVPSNYLQIPHFAVGPSLDSQRPLSKETPTQLQQQQDTVKSMETLLYVNQQKSNHVGDAEVTPHTGKDTPLWARRGGECKFALLDNLQQTTQEAKPERSLSHRRRSSLVVCLPGLEIFPGDLFISNGTEHLYRTASTPALSTESKKSKWPFTKRGMNKVKQKQISDLEGLLASLEIGNCTDHGFKQYQDKSWTYATKIQKFNPETRPEQKDKKLQQAMWEIFTSECTYFSDNLLVMEKVFLNTLKHLQSRGWLLDIDSWRLFANLRELSKVSFDFLTSLLDTIQSSWKLSSLAAVLSKWCEQNELCKRLHLSDLLVSPLQRLTKYPLLLRGLWKRSNDTAEKQSVQAIIKQVDNSICDLEGKVKWLESFQKFQQIQEMIVWPPIWERNKKVFLPESLRHLLKDNMAEGLLSPVNRQLLNEGRLSLAGATKFLDVYLFLFDDLLLITKIKSAKKKPGALDASLRSPSPNPELHGLGRDGTVCSVLDQPIPLDRLELKNIDPFHSAGCGLQNAFLVIHQNRYQQCIGIFTLQAPSEAVKKTWLSDIKTAATAYRNVIEPPQPLLRRLPVNESSEI